MSELIQIRMMQAAEQRLLLAWAALEGWNPGLHDAELYWQLDPEAFWGIEVDGALAGGGAIVRHSPHFGFMGLFIIQPEFRSRKMGTQLWYARRDQLLARLDTGATIGLDAVESMVPFYIHGGFQTHLRHMRFEWRPSPWRAKLTPDVMPLNSVDFEQVLALDAEVFPCLRPQYLRLWTQQPGAHACGVLRNGTLFAYGVLRRCVTGWKIGPLVAKTAEDAWQLLMAFGSLANDEPLYLDAPDNNSAALQICRELEMKNVFNCVRMYLGPVPSLSDNLIYSVTSLEIG